LSGWDWVASRRHAVSLPAGLPEAIGTHWPERLDFPAQGLGIGSRTVGGSGAEIDSIG
jgi:hypothetical protein